jgi:hypothetical protein
LGTIESDFLNGILNQLANTALYKGRVDENRLNFLLGMIKGFDPKDHLETMLATQMAAIQQNDSFDLQQYPNNRPACRHIAIPPGPEPPTILSCF